MSLAKRRLKILNISKFTKAECADFLRTRWTRRVHMNETAVRMNKKLCKTIWELTLRVHLRAFCSDRFRILLELLWKRSVTHCGFASWVILSDAKHQQWVHCLVGHVDVFVCCHRLQLNQYLGLIVAGVAYLDISSVNVIRLEFNSECQLNAVICVFV